jgi:hypothetical protein
VLVRSAVGGGRAAWFRRRAWPAKPKSCFPAPAGFRTPRRCSPPHQGDDLAQRDIHVQQRLEPLGHNPPGDNAHPLLSFRADCRNGMGGEQISLTPKTHRTVQTRRPLCSYETALEPAPMCLAWWPRAHSTRELWCPTTYAPDLRVPTVWRHANVPANCPEVVSMAAPASAPPAPSSLKRIVAASLIGTTIEWYDNSFDQN